MESIDLAVFVTAFILDAVLVCRMACLALTHRKAIWELVRRLVSEMRRCLFCNCQSHKNAFLVNREDQLRQRVAGLLLRNLN